MGSQGIRPGLIRFGPFALDTTSRELRKRGSLVKLQPQQFAVLLLLTERAGQIVSREEIHQHIWGNDTFVDFERGINFSINQIRAALGDDADKPRYIETIPRRGYRFICPVEATGQAIDPANGHAQEDESSSAKPMENLVSRAEPPDLPVMTNTAPAAESEAKNHQTANGARWKFTKWLLSGLGVATLLLVTALLLRGTFGDRHLRWPWLAKAKAVAPRGRTVPLTNFRGVAVEPVFSPDGKQIAFLWNGKDQRKLDLYVQMIGGEQPLRLTYSGIRQICCIDWSPDGQWISFVRCDNGVGGIFKVPVLGGAERKVTDVPCIETDFATPQWTRDGKSMLLSDRCAPNGPFGIVLFSFATGQRRCLASPPSNNTLYFGLNLSPDGTTVAFIRSTTQSMEDIYVLPLEGGSPRRLTADGKRLGEIMWAGDGKRIIFHSIRGGTLSGRLWNVSVDGGEIEPETVYPNMGTLSPDGRRVAFANFGGTEPPAIWQAELSAPGGPVLSQRRLIGSALYDGQPQLSPDRTKIVFASLRSGESEIWKSDGDGSNPMQLTSFGGELTGTPRWSPDGKWIVFDRRPGKHSQIYVIDPEGRNMHAITSGEYEDSVPSWSRDGQWIYFGSMRTGEWQLWKQKPEGGGPVQVTQHGGFTAFESYDGKTVYYSKREGEGIWSIPVGGGLETRVTGAPRLGDWGNWAVTETGLYLLDDDVMPRQTIEFYNFKTHKLAPVIPLEHSGREWDPGLDASRDGRTVLFVQWEPQVSLAMVENFQ
jgi:Tol biopolymer transport system component/DNA-binding winged helix-turn-helix (wHTH) protein